MMPSVSVLIRNRNEGSHLRAVLQRLRAQRTPLLEVIVVDNESTDESRAVIAEYGATLVHLAAGQFTYGRATNLGFSHARGDLVLMLSAHSLPVGTFFVDEVTAPFEDPRVAAVRIPIAANTNELRTALTRPPLDRQSTPGDVFGRGPVASGSVIRRHVWERFPVDETLAAAEDKEWALRILRDEHTDWLMPTANACYVYDRAFTGSGWLDKVEREERAGFQAAGLRRPASVTVVVATAAAGLRDAWRRTGTEFSLYRFRRRLR